MAQTKAKKAKTAKAKPGATKAKPKAKAPRNGSPKADQGQAVHRARIPLVAGGAALAGTVGGVVFGATRSGGKVLGVTLPKSKRVNFRSKDLARAAKELGRFGENMGDLTTELKRAREGLANGGSRHDSPIEILLKGLAHRR
jgi:hypothetical protein